jgi:hypothetical protein
MLDVIPPSPLLSSRFVYKLAHTLFAHTSTHTLPTHTLFAPTHALSHTLLVEQSTRTITLSSILLDCMPMTETETRYALARMSVVPQSSQL